MTSNILIKYHLPEDKLTRLVNYDKGDWIDLRCAEDVTLKAGESYKISFGISIKIPEQYEIWVAPRSSTFDKYGIIQTNSIGIIDNSYSGNDDIIMMPVLAMRDTHIALNERIAQFRLVPRMIHSDPMFRFGINFIEVDDLGTENRGGFGSSDNKF